MSAYPPSEASRSMPSGVYDDDRGIGWGVFAGVLLLIVGVMTTIESIAAIGNAHFFVHNTNYVFGDLNTWGWIVLCLGVMQMLIGGGVFVQNHLPAGPASSSSASTRLSSC